MSDPSTDNNNMVTRIHKYFLSFIYVECGIEYSPPSQHILDKLNTPHTADNCTAIVEDKSDGISQNPDYLSVTILNNMWTSVVLKMGDV